MGAECVLEFREITPEKLWSGYLIDPDTLRDLGRKKAPVSRYGLSVYVAAQANGRFSLERVDNGDHGRTQCTTHPSREAAIGVAQKWASQRFPRLKPKLSHAEYRRVARRTITHMWEVLQAPVLEIYPDAESRSYSTTHDWEVFAGDTETTEQIGHGGTEEEAWMDAALRIARAQGYADAEKDAGENAECLAEVRTVHPEEE